MAFELSSERDGNRCRVTIAGALDLDVGADLWRRLGHIKTRPGDHVQLDVAGIERVDGAAAALLRAREMEWLASGASVAFAGETGAVARQLELYGCEGLSCLKDSPQAEGTLSQIGRAVARQAAYVVAILDFIGRLVVAVVGAVRRPRSVPWRTVPGLAERAGADGVPIVILVNFLVGFTIALSGATILARYGANVFVAELVGFSILRELGPLMTAILVAGRSGAAYAAELGTMEVGEEVDALRTMSLDPVRYLVLPRVAALMLMVPLLTVVADVVGILGGFSVAGTTLGLSATTFFSRLQESVDVGDFAFGVAKSAVFAGAIALVACMRGLQSRGGASGVGTSTTSAVVISLFLLVILNAGFAFLGDVMGW